MSRGAWARFEVGVLGILDSRDRNLEVVERGFPAIAIKLAPGSRLVFRSRPLVTLKQKSD